MVALLCLAMAVVLAVVFLSISLATGGEVHWARLIIAAAFVLGLFGFYLWIRFSD